MRHLRGDQGRGVLRVRQRVAVRRGGVGAGVGRHDDQVAALALELRDELLGLLDQPGELHLPLDVGLVPDRDAGVGQAEDADLEGAAVADLVGLDDVRREHGALRRRVDGVGAEQREVQLRLEGAQRVDAVVELVVAERRGVVPDEVHRVGHRVLRALGDRVDLGVVVGQRGALDGVTGVEGEDRLALAVGPHPLDQRGHLRDADVVLGLVVELGVLEVVPVEDVAVQVGGAEHGEPHPLLASGQRRIGVAGGGEGRLGDVPGGRERGTSGEQGATRRRGLRHAGNPPLDERVSRTVLSLPAAIPPRKRRICHPMFTQRSQAPQRSASVRTTFRLRFVATPRCFSMTALVSVAVW